MKFVRHFTKPNLPIESQITWKLAESKITKSDGTIIFHMENIEVPDHWSQTAINILAQKYFRKAGVPNQTVAAILSKENAECNLPIWLTPQTPMSTTNFGFETSAKQVFHRLAGAWTYWGWKEGIFKAVVSSNAKNWEEENARIFYDEIYYMLAHQHAAPNSPQWFNTGLHWAYGITGDPNGQWTCDENGPHLTTNSYENPQPHACFIQPISDNLVEKNGIFDLLIKEALLFKHGSGTGTNFSNLRAKGEKLAGGGVSSGLMSFLKIFDTAAGAISSGGTTRRAAKMVCLDFDHPEIEEFINWKMKEEGKAGSLFLGSYILNKLSIDQIKNLLPEEERYKLQPIFDRIENNIPVEICNLNFEGEAMNTVSAQNANNSIRITNDFFPYVDNNLPWTLNYRGPAKTVRLIQAKDLWNKIITAAWACGDPGLQFDDIINEWHTCKNDGKINASNPCSEYMFLDNTACNLASLNLGKFVKNGEFLINDFKHATRLWTIVLEISVFMASFPSREIAENSYAYRTLGLGYMNLGGILMRLGLGYDSDEGRMLAAAITSLMHGVSYLTSSEMANELGPFSRWENNKESMLEVIQKHYEAMDSNISNTIGWSGFRRSASTWDLLREIVKIWKEVKQAKSFRNAQVTLLAPTGTIHLVTDCDTSGIEPDFSLIKYKNLSGGGNIQIVNECVPEALKTLGYTPAQIVSMLQHIKENGNLEEFTINHTHLPEEHLKVFDCANTSGNGKRFLRPMSHVLMMAAVQPFLSGAISKTCNLPNHATIQDVDFIYREAHRLGLKAIAIYRDGSKLTQPLSSKKEENKRDFKSTKENLEKLQSFGILSKENWEEIEDKKPNQINLDKLSRTLGYIGSPPTRRQLPSRRKGYTQKVRIDGQSIYLKTGEYEDGTLGEIWAEISREGSTVRALLGGFCKLASISLQFGVPLEQLVKSFVYTKFEPAGIVQDHDRIKMTTSIFDFIFRELAIHYLNQTKFSNVTNEEEKPIFLDLDSFKSPSLPLHEKTLETELVAYKLHLNFTGNICPNCGHATLKQTGSCVQCTTCGQDSGCG